MATIKLSQNLLLDVYKKYGENLAYLHDTLISDMSDEEIKCEISNMENDKDYILFSDGWSKVFNDTLIKRRFIKIDKIINNGKNNR